ncbi:hypothetical protein J4207_05305 [Candidatus Woesearchaeota archaeon]|nr:hypothetical protein [Candidatus Woesearchaeota archaeon]
MATFLDTLGILNFFAPLFTAILVFTIVFALLSKTKLLGANKVIDSLVAIVLGLLVLLVPDVVELVNFMAPWFVLMFIFLVMLLMLYQLFGMREESIVHFMLNDKAVNWALFAVGIIILAASIFTVYGQRALETGTAGDEFQSNLFSIIFNVKVLGLLLVFGIAVFTIAFLGGGSTSGGDSGGGHH